MSVTDGSHFQERMEADHKRGTSKLVYDKESQTIVNSSKVDKARIDAYDVQEILRSIEQSLIQAEAHPGAPRCEGKRALLRKWGHVMEALDIDRYGAQSVEIGFRITRKSTAAEQETVKQ